MLQSQDDTAAARWSALVGRVRAAAEAPVTEFLARVRAIGPYRPGLVPNRVRADAEALVSEFVERVRAICPYGRGLVPNEVLEADADRTFDYLLRRVAGQPVPERLLDIGPSIGRDRARRGVPLNDLLTAVRL